MIPSLFLPRNVKRFLLFFIIFIFVNIGIFLTSPISPAQVRDSFARSVIREREQINAEYEGIDYGDAAFDTSDTSFDDGDDLEESSAVTVG